MQCSPQCSNLEIPRLSSFSLYLANLPRAVRSSAKNFVLAFVFTLLACAANAQGVSIFPAIGQVGGSAQTLVVTVPITGGSLIGSSVVTQGNPNLDFIHVGTDSCSSSSCTVNVQFLPKTPGPHYGAVVLSMSSGNVIQFLYGIGAGPISVVIPGVINTIAGGKNFIYQAGNENIPADGAPIYLPLGEAVDALGNLYLSDSNNHRIRKVNPAGYITTYVGNGEPGSNGDGGSATSAEISTPSAIVVDGAGNLYFSDTGSNVIRMVDATPQHIITTIAGVAGSAGYNGPAFSDPSFNSPQPLPMALLSQPNGIALDPEQNLYIADTGNNLIRRIDLKITDPTKRTITTIAGSGAASYDGGNHPAASTVFNEPWGIAIGLDPNPPTGKLFKVDLYVADVNNNAIRKLDPHGILTSTTVAGSPLAAGAFAGDGGLATEANLQSPEGVAVDLAGNIYIADTQNNRIRKVTAIATATTPAWTISTLAGNKNQLFAGDGGNSDVASMDAPSSIALDNAGNIYFGDMFDNRVRKIYGNQAFLNYAQIKNYQTSTSQPEAIENDGNAPLTVTPFVPVNAALETTSSTCLSVTTLSSGQSCTLGVEFAPQVVDLPNDPGGVATYGTVTIPYQAPNTSGVINLLGNVLTVNPTTTTLSTSGSPSALGAQVTFTAVVSNKANGSLTGTVQFFDNGTLIGSSATIPAGTTNSGTASFTFSTTVLALGTHSITAIYGGDLNNAPSPVSNTVSQVVKSGTVLSLASSSTPSTFPESVTFTATLSVTANPVTGTISFSDGANSLGTFPVVAGKAMVSTATLAPGAHTITASFTEDTNNLAASATLTQTVDKAVTSTMLSASNSPVIFGNPVTFTATVVNNATPVTGEIVTFKDGTATIGTGVLDASGIASFTTSTLAPSVPPVQHSIAASYPGDTDNAPSVTTTPLTEIITQITTTTTVSSAMSPANAGASLALTATISGATTTGGSLTGTVQFFDGATALGTPQQVVTSPSGVAATLNTTALSVNPANPPTTHAITATYSGNTDYKSSTSSSYPQIIQQNTTTTTVSSNKPQATTAGTPVVFTAGVTGQPGSPNPTGIVKFTSGSTLLGSASLVAGQATLTVSSLPVSIPAGSSDPIIATYQGDTNDQKSASNTFAQVVNIATTSINITPSANPSEAGVDLTLTAALTGSGGPLTGSITIKDGTTSIGTYTIPANSSSSVSFVFHTSILSVSAHSITAVYSGDANNSPITSLTLNEVVKQVSTNTALLSNSNPGAFNQTITFTATVTSVGLTPGGIVDFLDGTKSIGTASLNAGGVASLGVSTLALGNHSITASYQGDANHLTSQSTAVAQRIVQAAAIALSSSKSPSIAETSVIFTAKLTGVQGLIPTGTVTFKDGTNILAVIPVDGTGSAPFSTASLSVGTHLLVASYSGDTNYQPIDSSVFSQTVQVANTTVTLTSTANPATAGSALTLSSVVTGTGGTVTGSVTFEDGTTPLGTSAVNNATGVATFTTTALSPGEHTITAVFGGDSNNNPNSSAILRQQVQQVTVATLASSANPALTLTPIVVTCTVTNGGTQHATGQVTFTDGSSILGKVMLDVNGVATLSLPSLSAGAHQIIASYTGDVADFPDTSAPLTQVVQLRPTTDVLTATSTSLTGGQQLTLISVVRWTGPVAPTGSVVFKEGSTVIGTAALDNIGVATLTIILDPGAATMVASYSGDSVYAPSDSAATPLTDGPPTSFTMQLSSSAITLASKQNTTVNITISSLNSFSDVLTLGCLGLPFAATCTFSTDQSSLSSNGVQTIHLVIDTGSPLTAGSVAKNDSGANSSTTKYCFLPCGALLGWLLMRSRKRRPLMGLLLVLCSIGLALGVSGCGTLNQSGTPAGTYSFKITASGLKTGVTQSTDMTLTVTK